jgi:hypothetical protein
MLFLYLSVISQNCFLTFWTLSTASFASLHIVSNCSETTLTGESRFQISIPLGNEHGSLMTWSKWVDHWTSGTVWMQWDCRLYTGLPPSSRRCRLWSRKEDLQRAWNWGRRAVWDQVGLSHCWHDGLVMVRDEACLRWGLHIIKINFFIKMLTLIIHKFNFRPLKSIWLCMYICGVQYRMISAPPLVQFY